MTSELKCVVNGARDLRMDGDAKPFIGQPCLFIKVAKSGQYVVALESNPKLTLAVPQRNVTFNPPKTHGELAKFSLDRLRATEVRSPSQ